MSETVKRNSNVVELATVDQIPTYSSTSRDNADGALPIVGWQCQRWGRIAFFNVSSPVSKAMANGTKTWLGSLWAPYLPAVDVTNYPTQYGYVTIRRDTTTPSRADVSFTPSIDLTTSNYLYILVPYLTL